MEYKDYYSILGIAKSASTADIKKAFRKLAMKYHPDKNPGDKAAEKKFHEINEAHEVLADSEKRKKYDQFGSEWQQYQQAGQTPGGASSYRSSRNRGRSAGGFETSFDFSEIFGGGGNGDFFEALFGQRSGSASGMRNQAGAPGVDLTAEAPVTLEEAYHGTSRLINLNGQTIKLTIKPGIADGQQLRLRGKGEPGSIKGRDGDLLVKVQVLAHTVFDRKGDDLYCTVPVDIYTALLGGRVLLVAFKGSVNLKIPPETDNGQVLKLTGMGMPLFGRKAAFGDLYVKVDVKLPQNLTPQEKKAFEELRGQRPAM